MDVRKLVETNEAIAMLEGLKLPVALEQLEKRKTLENEYLSENVIPQVQAYIQSLVDNLHKSFCLVVDYEYGSPVQVRIAEKKIIKGNTQGLQKNHKPQGRIIGEKYKSERIEQELDLFFKSLPQGALFYKYAITQSYHSLSKVLHIFQTRDMMKYTKPLFKILNLPTTGNLSPTAFINLLEPEQIEITKDGNRNEIVLWSQSQKIEVRNGTRIKRFKPDGITPIMVDKTKRIKEGKWTLKTLCDIMSQKEYFANKHS